MITPAVIGFSLASAATVWLAGRRDAARDPLLTLLVLGLLAVFPVLSHGMPKVEVAGLPGLDLAWFGWFGWIWAAGVLVFSIRLGLALLQLTLWRMRSRPLEDAEFRDHKPEIRMLEGLASPVAAGILRPLILVPEAWRDWGHTLRQTVILHETTHHKRHDPLWRAIASITCTLHWFNPLVWWMSARLADQCEFACDERVIQTGLARRDYAHVLCDLAAVSNAPATALAMANHCGLETRVRRMFSPPPPRAWGNRLVPIVLVLSTAAALSMLERKSADWNPRVDAEEIRTRLHANPFPINHAR